MNCFSKIKLTFLFICFASSGEYALASCPLIDKVKVEFKTSPFGITDKINEKKVGFHQSNKISDFILFDIPNDGPKVYDGFTHQLVIDLRVKEVWLRSKGGWSPVEWRGPIEVDPKDLEACLTSRSTLLP